MALLPSGIAKTGEVPFQIYPKTIDQSLRFEDGDQPRIERTPASSGSLTTWTLSWWVKPGNLGISRYMFSAYDTGASTYTLIRFHTDNSLHILKSTGYSMNLSRVFRDPSAWYHMVYVWDTTNAIAEDRDRLYVNGERITTFDSRTQPSLNENSDWNQGSIIQTIGNSRLNLTVNQMDGYMAEIHFTDGTAYEPTDFGELRSGIWVPKDVDVTYGTNGFYLDFADSAAIGDDESGNGNDWTATNLVASDVVPDSPTNNFAVLNPLTLTVGYQSNGTLSEGNLQWIGTFNNDNLFGTMAVSSGQWYYEIEIVANASNLVAGWSTTDETVNSNEAALVYYNSAGIRQGNKTVVWDSDVTTGLTFAVNDIIGFALDIDGGDLKVYQNNSLVSTITLPTDKGDEWIPAFGDDSSTDASFRANFGQDSTFAGNTTAGGNSDANGIGDFQYAPPSGFLALCASNLPDPVFDPAEESTADQYFNVYTYTGNGASQLIGDVVREIPDTVSIDQSLRFDHAGSTYLTFDPASDGDKTEWTFSTWFKRTGVDARMIFGQGTSGSNNRDIIYLEATGELQVASYGGSYVFQFVTDRIFNDSAAWYHLVVAYDSSQATDTDRVKIWVNGVLLSNFSTNTKPSLNASTAHFNSGSPQYIGKYIDQGTYWNGYQAETHWIDGTAYAATDFGEYDADGIWTPITPSVTYGTNGWHIDYSSASYTDNGSDPDTFADQANSNDFSAYGIAAEDIVLDTPTNSFPVFDGSSLKGGSITLSQGNSYYYKSSTGWAGARQLVSTALPSTGKWYYELIVVGGSSPTTFVGLATRDAPTTYAANSESYMFYSQNGDYYSSSTNVSYGTAWANAGNRVIGIAYDADNATLEFFINNSSQGTVSVSGGHTGKLYPVVYAYTSTEQGFLNFGQDGTGAGTYTGSQDYANYEGAADGNGEGEFFYTPPTGFLALCENNLIQYDDNPLESPDFVWIKNRSGTGKHHQLYDSVRGVQKALKSNVTNAEADEPTGLTSFNKNGFVIGDDDAINTSGVEYVAWTWKAGGTGVSNTDGSITSTVSANTDAGFAIAGYEGAGGTQTVGHGLSQKPEMIIVKRRETAGEQWVVWVAPQHLSTNTDGYLELNTANIDGNNGNIFTTTAPTASVFSIGNSPETNSSGLDYISYCFHSVDQYSKVGIYTGNGSSDGTFVFTGFRPKFLLTKNVSGATADWRIYDSERLGYNASQYLLIPNTSAIELASTEEVDFLSNGFKCRDTDTALNTNGVNYIYYAIAEQPFKFSNAR